MNMMQDRPFNIMIDDVNRFIGQAAEIVVAEVDGDPLANGLPSYHHLCGSLASIAEGLFKRPLGELQRLLIRARSALRRDVRRSYHTRLLSMPRTGAS